MSHETVVGGARQPVDRDPLAPVLGVTQDHERIALVVCETWLDAILCAHIAPTALAMPRWSVVDGDVPCGERIVLVRVVQLDAGVPEVSGSRTKVARVRASAVSSKWRVPSRLDSIHLARASEFVTRRGGTTSNT